MQPDPLRIIVTGMVGTYPLGGVAWDYFHYLLALAELGHDVYYHEDTRCWINHPELGYLTDDPSYTVDYFIKFFEQHAPHLKEKWHYLHLGEKHFGMTAERFDEVARSADVYLNVSSAGIVPDTLGPHCRKAIMDTDPGYNQIVMAASPEWAGDTKWWLDQFRSYDCVLTYAENIWNDDCVIPRLDLDWRPTRCVVTMQPWARGRNRNPPANAAFTTVMSWRYFKGPLVWNGVSYDAKASEFEKFFALPKRVKVPLAVAVAGHQQPAEKIRDNGWISVDAKAASLTPQNYVDFIWDSLGEWSIAKNCYVGTRSGWFSCRTACYLAAGRPAVVQDTAWSRFIPSGEGLIAFDTMDEAVAGIEAILSDPMKHRRAAYDIAREYLAPDRVLPPMIEAIFSTSRTASQLPPSKKSEPRRHQGTK